MPSSPISCGSAPVPVSVGNALVQSKLAYLRATPEIKGMHEKALLTASVFGLPMFSINMGGTRDTTAAGGSQVTTNNTLGVTSGDLALTNSDFQVPAAPVAGPNGTTYFTGRDGVASNPGEPALPRYVANVDVSEQGPPRRRLPERDLLRDLRCQAVRRRARYGVRWSPDPVHLDDLLSVPDVDRELLR